MTEKISYLADMDALEPFCIALRVRSTIIFAYPICDEVLKTNPKVITKTGKVVKHLQPAMKDNERVLIGELEGERIVWDSDGNFIGEDQNSELKLYCPERYFLKGWKNHIKLSNSEWALKYQRPHPTVKIPDAWAEKARRRLYND